MSVASQLIRKLGRNADVCIIEPADDHWYQAAWTMVGGGLYNVDNTKQPMASVLPSDATWIKERCAEFKPEENKVTLADGNTISYDYLVVAAGLKVNFGAVEGLEETLGKNGVASNYCHTWAPHTWANVERTRKGVAIFSDNIGPIKCGGAPQKVAFLAEDAWRKAGVRQDIDVEFVTGKPALFAVPEVCEALTKTHAKKGITTETDTLLVKVDGPNRIASFKKKDGSIVEKKFDFLHAVPPMSAPDFIAKSPLADESGFVTVDKGTLQHTKHANVFALGDCSGAPSAKTYAAISAQSPVVVTNLQAVMDGKPPKAQYDGYSCCPILLGENKTMMAEFKYDAKLCGTFRPFLKETDPSRLFFIMKRFVFPWVYFQFAPLGRWYGKRAFIAPFH
jgi:sulfide:quinone oxidoreductase